MTHFAPSVDLLRYEILGRRKYFTPQEQQQYRRLSKGMIGENKLKEFFRATNDQKLLPLFDHLYEVNQKEFQIDCLLITSNTLYVLEVKNYTGDYYIEHDKVYSRFTNAEIQNPFLQLERTTFLFNKLLDQLQIKMKVQAYVIFINSQCSIYQAPLHLPMILPTQVKRFLKQLNKNTMALQPHMHTIAKKLMEYKKESSTYERLPTYTLTELKQGVFCQHCTNKLERTTQSSLLCVHCKKRFHLEAVIMHAVASFHLLFPKDNITVQKINDWCGRICDRKTVRKILQSRLIFHQKGRYSYYTFANKKEVIDHLQFTYQEISF